MGKQQLKIKEPGLWEIQDSHLAFPSSLTILLFIWKAKAFPGCGVNISQWEKMVKVCFLQSPVIGAPTLLDRSYRHWQKLHELLGDYCFRWCPWSSSRNGRIKGSVAWDWVDCKIWLQFSWLFVWCITVFQSLFSDIKKLFFSSYWRFKAI